MAIIKSDNGPMIKKSGNHIYKIVHGKNIQCKAPLRVHNPKTPKQQTQRAKWGPAVQLAKQFAPVYQLGLKGMKNGKTPYNNFMSLNVNNVIVDENLQTTFDYEKLVCSKGELIKPKVSVSIKDGSARISKTEQSVQAWAAKDDQIHVVFYEKVMNSLALISIGTRDSSGSSLFTLLDDWQEDNVVCYAFAVSKTGKHTSNTLYILPEIES